MGSGSIPTWGALAIEKLGTSSTYGALKMGEGMRKVRVVWTTHILLLLHHPLQLIARWTKLFWIDVLQQKIKEKQSDTHSFVVVLNFTKFHTWKLIFIRITQERLALHLVQIGNWVTKVCKITRFRRKKESHLKYCFAKKLFTCWWIFCQDLDRKAWERPTTYLGEIW